MEVAKEQLVKVVSGSSERTAGWRVLGRNQTAPAFTFTSPRAITLFTSSTETNTICTPIGQPVRLRKDVPMAIRDGEMYTVPGLASLSGAIVFYFRPAT